MQTDPDNIAYRETAPKDTPGGCALGMIGFVFLFASFRNFIELRPIAFLLGVIFILLGGYISKMYICSVCGNRLEETSKMCPACKARICDQSEVKRAKVSENPE